MGAKENKCWIQTFSPFLTRFSKGNFVTVDKICDLFGTWLNGYIQHNLPRLNYLTVGLTSNLLAFGEKRK